MYGWIGLFFINAPYTTNGTFLVPLAFWPLFGSFFPSGGTGSCAGWSSRFASFPFGCFYSLFSKRWVKRTLGTLRLYVAQGGLFIAFLLGLGWLTWFVDRQSRLFQFKRLAMAGNRNAHGPVGPLRAMHSSIAVPEPGLSIWNPFDMDAWYYGSKRQKLRQSISVMFGYLVLFLLLVFLLFQLSGCHELYEMPAGGGEQNPTNRWSRCRR